MNPRAKEVYRLVKELHSKVYLATKGLHQEAAECVDMQELADLAYAMRDAYKFLDDMRRAVDQTKKTAERMACLVWTKGEGDGPIRTDYCVASPKVRMMCKLPHRKNEPEAYAAMMEGLGVSPDLYESIEVVRPHWPGFIDYLSRLAEEGKPLPRGLDANKQYPIYSLLIRAKKGMGTESDDDGAPIYNDAALRIRDTMRVHLMDAAMVVCENDRHKASVLMNSWIALTEKRCLVPDKNNG